MPYLPSGAAQFGIAGQQAAQQQPQQILQQQQTQNYERQRMLAEAMMQRGMNAGPAQSDLEGAANAAQILAAAFLNNRADRREDEVTRKEETVDLRNGQKAEDLDRQNQQALDSALNLDPTSEKRDAAIQTAASRAGETDLVSAMRSRQIERRPEDIDPETVGLPRGSIVQRLPNGELRVVSQPPAPQRPPSRQTVLGGDGGRYYTDTGENTGIPAIPARNLPGARSEPSPPSSPAALEARYTEAAIDGRATRAQVEWLNRLDRDRRTAEWAERNQGYNRGEPPTFPDRYPLPDARPAPAPGRRSATPPPIGHVENGYRFTGGDPTNRANWQNVGGNRAEAPW